MASGNTQRRVVDLAGLCCEASCSARRARRAALRTGVAVGATAGSRSMLSQRHTRQALAAAHQSTRGSQPCGSLCTHEAGHRTLLLCGIGTTCSVDRGSQAQQSWAAERPRRPRARRNRHHLRASQRARAPSLGRRSSLSRAWPRMPTSSSCSAARAAVRARSVRRSSPSADFGHGCPACTASVCRERARGGSVARGR